MSGERNCVYCHNFEVCKEKGTITEVTRREDDFHKYVPGLHNDCLTWFLNPPTKKGNEDGACNSDRRECRR